MFIKCKMPLGGEDRISASPLHDTGRRYRIIAIGVGSLTRSLYGPVSKARFPRDLAGQISLSRSTLCVKRAKLTGNHVAHS